MRDALRDAFTFAHKVWEDSPAIGNVKSWSVEEIRAELRVIADKHGVDFEKMLKRMY